MLRICIIVLLAIATSACSKTTFVRSAPDYSKSLTKNKKVLFLPPKVEVNQIDAFGKKTRVYDYEDHLEEKIEDILVNKMQEKGYNVRFLSRAEIGNNKLSHFVVDTKDNLDDTLTVLYKDGAWKEDKAHAIDQKIPSSIELGKKAGADLLILMNFDSFSKTSGAVTKDFAMAIFASALTGRSAEVNAAALSQVKIAIINVMDGKVLWTNSVFLAQSSFDTSLSNFSDRDKVDKENLGKLFATALLSLPDAE